MRLAQESSTAAHWLPDQYRAIFHADADGARRIALVAGDAIVEGFLVARCIGKEWELENVVVTPQKRRNGFATCLLAEFIQVTRREGAKSVFLEVRESNLPARALYEKAGFAAIGKRSSYYRDPEENAATYRLTLG
jgi:[ribosomal protein S18]-alanine N-acetyltransferase